MSYKRVLKPVLAVLVLMCIFLTSFIFKTEAADMVVVEENTNCDLTYLSISNSMWPNKGSLNKNGNEYVLTSNGYAQWYTEDCFSFGYVPVAFNYSDAQLTVETTMTSWNGTAAEAGAGLMIRSGLNSNSSCIMFHCRPGSIMITYRMTDGEKSFQGKTLTIATSGLYPVSFKAVLEKGKSKVQCYYKIGENGEYISFGAAPFNYSDNLYAGISAYSRDETYTATAKFSSFSYKVEAPEGYTVGPGSGSGGTEIPPEPEDILPEDYPATEDTLLRETFTDGSMFDGEASVTNPIWKSNAEEANIVTNEEKTNRYLAEYLMDGTYYYAGDQNWTDYKMSARFNFTNEYAPEEANELYFLVRHTDIAQYGYQFYYVGFMRDNSKNLIMGIGRCDGLDALGEIDGSFIDGTTVYLDYLADDFIDKWHDIEITAFDNTISVSLDNGTWSTSYTDNSPLCKTEGNIGFLSIASAVNVDDILVTKLEDYMGGDYDNQIGGNWEQPIPEYLKRFEELGMPY